VKYNDAQDEITTQNQTNQTYTESTHNHKIAQYSITNC